MSQSTTLVSKAPVIGEGKEQWVANMKFTCVHCRETFPTRSDLIRHYDGTRHDKYSAWK
ncbi:MAG TPA: hypothetical protein VN739_02305 [Nitrososphaerales archaeon]|nr:hypothetical protein [Nitrososphaerales archaeon]